MTESARSRLGDPYVFGARGEACTTANRKKYARADYPSIINDCPVLTGKASKCSQCDNNGRHIYECRGFTYKCLLDAGITIEGAGATSQWNTASNWAAKGTTDDMPDLVCCLFKAKDDKMSHTGLHIGSGYIIHCSGEVKTGMLDTTWTNWAIPIGLYDKATINNAKRIKTVTILKKGSTGEAVKTLQQNLKTLGYDPGKIDGVYGTATVKAVKEFQSDHLLTVDGIAGMATQAAIDEAIKGQNNAPDGAGNTDGIFIPVEQYNRIRDNAQAILDALSEVRYR